VRDLLTERNTGVIAGGRDVGEPRVRVDLELDIGIRVEQRRDLRLSARLGIATDPSCRNVS
jgi:hypothetical protein